MLCIALMRRQALRSVIDSIRPRLEPLLCQGYNSKIKVGRHRREGGLERTLENPLNRRVEPVPGLLFQPR
jgi:hypothetical protein